MQNTHLGCLGVQGGVELVQGQILSLGLLSRLHLSLHGMPQLRTWEHDRPVAQAAEGRRLGRTALMAAACSLRMRSLKATACRSTSLQHVLPEIGSVPCSVSCAVGSVQEPCVGSPQRAQVMSSDLMHLTARSAPDAFLAL